MSFVVCVGEVRLNPTEYSWVTSTHVVGCFLLAAQKRVLLSRGRGPRTNFLTAAAVGCRPSLRSSVVRTWVDLSVICISVKRAPAAACSPPLPSHRPAPLPPAHLSAVAMATWRHRFSPAAHVEAGDLSGWSTRRMRPEHAEARSPHTPDLSLRLLSSCCIFLRHRWRGGLCCHELHGRSFLLPDDRDGRLVSNAAGSGGGSVQGAQQVRRWAERAQWG